MSMQKPPSIEESQKRAELRHYGPEMWSNDRELFHDLVPFKHLENDPWDNLLKLQRWLRDLPPTCSTWLYREVDVMGVDTIAHGRSETFAYLTGAWPMGSVQTGGDRWVNPYYPKASELDWVPVEDKVTHWERLANLGVFCKREAAGRYNLTTEAVYHRLKHRGLEWGAIRQRAKSRLANTVATTREWDNRSWRELGESLDMPQSTLIGFVNTNQTMEVPERPCDLEISDRW